LRTLSEGKHVLEKEIVNGSANSDKKLFTEVVLKCWIVAAQWEIQAPEKVCFDAGFRLKQ
jgi:hypothetical protein